MRGAENGVDVDIVFRVVERRTGNINFGASVGQGVGVGGFIGLEEPNLFGRAKQGRPRREGCSGSSAATSTIST
jgi:outer membrane protein assembly factor BamA